MVSDFDFVLQEPVLKRTTLIAGVAHFELGFCSATQCCFSHVHIGTGQVNHSSIFTPPFCDSDIGPRLVEKCPFRKNILVCRINKTLLFTDFTTTKRYFQWVILISSFDRVGKKKNLTILIFYRILKNLKTGMIHSGI